MAIEWTERQRQVIYGRNKNMLVSAAAGSGKTAVLVNRIISLLTDEEAPADLDRFLIVTFTKAAAGEMKERIRRALDAIAADGKANEHIRRQSVLVHGARISTIHSFCAYVVKNYFYTIDVDPSFRIMDDGERKLMMSDCALETLQAAYAAQDEDAVSFAADYGTGKSQRSLVELLIRAHEAVSAQAFGDVWLRDVLAAYDVSSKEGLLASPFAKAAVGRAKEVLAELKAQAEACLIAARAPVGCRVYAEAFASDVELIERLLEGDDLDEMRALFADLKFKTLGRGSSPDEDKSLRERLGKMRKDIKDGVTELKKKYFGVGLDELLEETARCRKQVETFIRLLEAFSERFKEKKRAANLADYGDLEHLALTVLLKRNEDGTPQRTQAAKEIASGFDHVMTDEYQDSNDIQELILYAVSGNEDGRNNRFMVGDIKQSIYGFRNARPEIFMTRYEEYKKGDSGSEVIDLYDNFRSGGKVIDTLNYIFERLMSRRMGGVDYDDTQALHQGNRTFDDGQSSNSELLLIDAKDPDIDDDGEELAQTEAVLIANEIKKLKNEMYINGANGQRPFTYGDCAVLVRTTAMAESVSKTLIKEGVPAYAQSRTGYFSATEVALTLNYIRILDNPLQDVPFASVLFSHIAGCSAEELAEIKLACPAKRYYDSALAYCESQSGALCEKLRAFFDVYFALRKKAKYLSVHALIYEIYECTGIRTYAAAMPAGAIRAANLDMLLQKADAYEKTSYNGLFNFIRYIEELQKYDEDMGEANLFAGGADAVGVMTIHKSKGLEFPVVFVSGCGKGFNNRGSAGSILMHRDLGIGLDIIDYAAGKKKTTLYKKLIGDAISEESRSEELRILYVALTRAREKLYMTAVVPDLKAAIEKALSLKAVNSQAVSRFNILKAKSYAELILQALSPCEEFAPLAHWCGRYDEKFSRSVGCVKCRVISADSLIRAEAAKKSELYENIAMLPKPDEIKLYDARVHDFLETADRFEYPYKESENIPIKISVSDIKRLHLMTDDEQSGLKTGEPEEVFPYTPEFMQKGGGERGAYRGTAYHKLWKYLNYKRLPKEDENAAAKAVREQLEELQAKSLLTSYEAESIDVKDFAIFALSPLGKRMYEADMRGALVREQPFTALMPADEAGYADGCAEEIIVQGVIDAYFEENGGYVLVDYKTDRVRDAKELAERYASQLRAYAYALEKNSKKQVAELLIYSTHLKKCVIVDSN